MRRTAGYKAHQLAERFPLTVELVRVAHCVSGAKGDSALRQGRVGRELLFPTGAAGCIAGCARRVCGIQSSESPVEYSKNCKM